jgi:uncharacterized repeat protein (TIGR03803 family)
VENPEYLTPIALSTARSRERKLKPYIHNVVTNPISGGLQFYRLVNWQQEHTIHIQIKPLFTRRRAASRDHLVLAQLLASLGLMTATAASGQTFTTLHSFASTGLSPSGLYTNSDGANSYAGLILSSNTLYGTTSIGGLFGAGTVFRVNTDGSGFTNLHSFTNNSTDGANPYAGLVLSGNTLYGTANSGGRLGLGTVFKVNTDGTGFKNLHSFTNSTDGANPCAGLLLSGNTLYGTTHVGGSTGGGTVFKLNLDGAAFAALYSFIISTDGDMPFGGLVLSGDTLYGATAFGGGAGSYWGAVFAVNTNGTAFTTLHVLTGGYYPFNDGPGSYAGLALSDDTLFGVTGSHGIASTVFKLNSDGSGFTTLYAFTPLSGGDRGTNSDGGLPNDLIVSGNMLYGTTGFGGSNGQGTLFALNIDGTGFTNLYIFTGGEDGAQPSARLLLSGNTLYGATWGGGSGGSGTVFSISFPPQLTITPAGTDVILSWPTNFAGFDYAGYVLQSTTNLAFPTAWITNSPSPFVIGAQNVVTNPISGAQQFYRLIR